MQPMQIGGLSHEKCSIFAASPSDCWGSGDITILWELARLMFLVSRGTLGSLFKLSWPTMIDLQKFVQKR
jgi:hypothetical protein